MKHSLRESPRDTPRVSNGAIPRQSNAADDQLRRSQDPSFPLRPYNPQQPDSRANPAADVRRPYNPEVDGKNEGGYIRRKVRKHRPNRGKTATDHFVAAVGEFIGTVLFLWFAFAWHLTVSDQASEVALRGGGNSAQTVIFISIGYGFSLLTCAWAFYRISGGLYNPAVTLGMVLTGNLAPVRGLVLLPAQILGAIVAAALVQCMFPGDIGSVNCLLAPGVSVAQGVFIEMFLTVILVFTILMLAAEKSKVTFMAPLGIGLSLFVAELAGVYYTGGAVNPARAFGPAVVSHKFPTYHWIYWVGPILGALVTTGFYYFVKFFNYEDANPGQDSAGGEFVDED